MHCVERSAPDQAPCSPRERTWESLCCRSGTARTAGRSGAPGGTCRCVAPEVSCGMTLPLVCIGRYDFLCIQHCFLWPKPRAMFAHGAVIARADWQAASCPRLRSMCMPSVDYFSFTCFARTCRAHTACCGCRHATASLRPASWRPSRLMSSALASRSRSPRWPSRPACRRRSRAPCCPPSSGAMRCLRRAPRPRTCCIEH